MGDGFIGKINGIVKLDRERERLKKNVILTEQTLFIYLEIMERYIRITQSHLRAGIILQPDHFVKHIPKKKIQNAPHSIGKKACFKN